MPAQALRYGRSPCIFGPSGHCSGGLAAANVVATIFGILEYNLAEHQYNPAEHQYNPAEHQYNPAEHQYNPAEHQYNAAEHQYNPAEHAIAKTP